MCDATPLEPLLDGARLKTAPTLADFVRHLNIYSLDADDKRFEALTYDAAPIVRALFCRELATSRGRGSMSFSQPTLERSALSKATSERFHD